MFTLLLVDDETSLLDTGKIFLERKSGFVVHTATSAPAALALMKSTDYDAIISDYQMPGMDGIDFLKQVRGSGNAIPFILFTGRGREEIVIQALNEGADYYLQKGGDPKSQFAELSHKIIQAVQRRKAEISIRDHERREQDIISFLPDATFAIDASGMVIAWNQAMEQLTGVTASQILGKGNYEYAVPLYHERRPILIDLVLKDDPGVSARYPRIIRDRNTLCSEIRIPHLNDGKGAWLWFIASPLYNDRNEVVGAIESIRDITDKKEAQDEIQAQNEELQASFEQITATEEELRQNLDELTTSHAALEASEDKYRRIVDTANEGIWVMDRDLRTTFVNQRMADILGYRREEMQGRTVDSFIVPEDLPDHRIRLEERKQGERGKYERRFHRRDGSVVWAQVSSTPLINRSGEFEGSFAMFTDITGRKLAEEALQRRNEELSASYEQISATEEELRQNYDELQQYGKILHESEERYRTVFENTGTATVLIEEDTVISIANEQFALMSGYTREEIEGRMRWTDFVVPEDVERMIAQHRLRRESPDAAQNHYEFRFIPRFGEVRTIFLTVGVIPGTKRSVASLLDITSRKRAGEERARIAREWQRTFDATDDAIWILDMDQRVLRSNRTAGRIFGRSCKEFIGKHCWEIVHGTGQPIPECPLLRARKSLHRETMELQIRDRWFEITVDPILDSEGRYAGAVHIASDITDRRRAEAALRDSEAEFRDFFNHTGDAIVIHDLQGRFLAVNDEICRRLGYTREEMLAMTPADIDEPDYGRKVNDRIATLQQTGQIVFETVHRTKDGTLIPTEVSSRMILYHGKPAILSTGRDITERKRVEDALRRVNRQLTMMTSITRHDINNQILVILSYLDIARMRSTDPEMEEFISKIELSTKVIRSQIEFTKVYQNLGSQKPQWLALDPLLRRLHVPAPVAMSSMVNNLDVYADPLLEKVFFNLLDNSLRHGGHVTEIRVSSRQNNGGLTLVWEDNGAGIAVDDKEQIFERGYGKNTGLGLFLVREILSLTGMSIRETGIPGKGARFEISVPDGMFRVV